MSHYEDAFGTEWGDLDRQDVLTRAYALGVAAACGDRNPDELARLVDEVDTTYDRSMVELAFHEGKQEGGSLRGELDDDTAVWAALVDGEEVAFRDDEPEADEDDGDGDATERRSRGQSITGSKRPTALSRATLLDRQTPDDRDALRLPEFLNRD